MGYNWKITWRDTSDVGLRETTIGTKYIRYLANVVGGSSPDREWMWTKDLYLAAGALYGRHDWRAVERACRAAIEAAGLKCSTRELVYELAELAWDRREQHGIPDEKGGGIG